MSIGEILNAPEAAIPDKKVGHPAAPAGKLRKQVFTTFGSIVVVGLALIGWYVAYRIIATERQIPAPVLASVPQPLPVAVPAPTPPPVQISSAPPVQISSAPPVQITSAPPVQEVAPPAMKAPVQERPKPPATQESKPRTARIPAPTPVTASVESKAAPSRPVRFERHDAIPRHGERYLQIAAYGPKSLDDYLKRLERNGMHPLVAPGPSENIYRILIGPFEDSDALEKARRSIQVSGIEPILRSY